MILTRYASIHKNTCAVTRPFVRWLIVRTRNEMHFIARKASSTVESGLYLVTNSALPVSSLNGLHTGRTVSRLTEWRFHFA